MADRGMLKFEKIGVYITLKDGRAGIGGQWTPFPEQEDKGYYFSVLPPTPASGPFKEKPAQLVVRLPEKDGVEVKRLTIDLSKKQYEKLKDAYRLLTGAGDMSGVFAAAEKDIETVIKAVLTKKDLDMLKGAALRERPFLRN